MARLWLSLLGGFSVTLDDQPVNDFESDKVRALLAYLTMQVGRPQRREALAALLWPELPEQRARHNLRQALFNLRAVIGDQSNHSPFLTITPQTIHLNSSEDFDSDVAFFTQAITPCYEHTPGPLTYCTHCLERREEAAGIYRGRFLNGFNLKNCQDFNEWALVEDQNLHHRAVGALEWLVNIFHGLGQTGQMLVYARQWAALEPYDEAAHRAIMLALALNGQWGAAARQYEFCWNLLVQELEAEPDAQTQALYGYLSSGELPVEYTTIPLIQADLSKPLGHCPYRGLAAFREVDAPLFFGREVFIERLQFRFQSYPAFTVILGPSGSGKSSVVYAGLLPGLRQDKDWLIVKMRPGGDPFQALEVAFQALQEAEQHKGGVFNGVRAKQDLHPFDLCQRVAGLADSTQTVLLFLDQFEELYTLCPDVEIRQHFLNELLRAVEIRRQAGGRRCLVLLTLRADFMGQALSYRPFADALQDACLLMGPMNREELQAAIQKPAELRGVGFESGLVARLLDDVGEEPGNLPLLEFALTLLWERGENGQLTHAAYEQIGRVQGALASYADLVYNDLRADELERARQVFLQLVQPGDGTEDTRRIALREEQDDAKWALVQRLADQRLVVTGRDQAGNDYVEVAHEALIHRWGRFQEWLRVDRAFRVWQERLRSSLRQWEHSGEHESALLRGLPLAEADSWLAERSHELNQAEQHYIQASLELQVQRQKAQDRRRRLVISALASGLLIALLLVFFIWQQRQESRRQASIGLASQAISEIQGPYPERAVLLALEALEKYPYTWQAERALSQAVLDNRLRRILVHDDYVNTAEWSADGTQILTGSSDGTLRVWDASSGQELWRISEGAPDFARWSPDGKTILAVNAEGHELTAWDLEDRTQRFTLNQADIGGAILINSEQWAPWSPTGDRFLTYNDVGIVKIWDGQTGQLLSTLENSLGQGERLTVASEDAVKILHNFFFDQADKALWSPDGRAIAASSQAYNQVTVWDAESGQEQYAIAGGYNDQRVFMASWSPSGDRFTTRGSGGVEVYDRASGKLLLSLPTPGVLIYRAIWSPDGSKLLTTGVEDGTARVWDAETGAEIMQLSNLDYAAGSDWSPDGEYAAAGGNDGFIHIILPENARQFRALSGTQPRITIVQFSPQSDCLLSVGDDNHVLIYDLSEALVSENFVINSISSVSWSPDGQQVALGFGGHLVKVWDAVTGIEIATLDGHTGDVWFVKWSPAGDHFATVSSDHTAIVWDAMTWEQLIVFRGHDGEVFCVDWSPDGSQIATSSSGKAIVWDPDTGEEILTFGGHSDIVVFSEWSPDGSRILSVGSNGEALIWDAASGEVIYDLYPGDFQLNVVSGDWSGDGARVFLQTTDGAIRIFDASAGKEQGQFFMASATASQMSLSPSEDRLLKGGDGGAIVWDIASGTERLRYDYPGWVDAGYSPDGTRIAMGSNLGTLEIYPTWQSTQELIDYARECCLVRELTNEERQLFGLSPLGD